MKHRIRSVIILLLAMALLFAVPTMMAGYQTPHQPLTMDEHIKNVSADVRQRFIEGDAYEFEDFEVHPIFNAITGEFSNYLLIEFAPLGFVYVEVYFFEMTGLFVCHPYRRAYYYYLTGAVSNRASHFYGIGQAQRYFFFLEDRRSIPAVRQGDKFLNLRSNELFYESFLENQESIVLGRADRIDSFWL